MVEEKNNILEEAARRYKKLRQGQVIVIWGQRLLIVLGAFLAIDFHGKLETRINTSDGKLDAWIKQMNNITVLHTQQIDSLMRLDRSIKIGNDSMNMKLELYNNCR